MRSQIALPSSVWSKLLAAWVLFFAGMGAANIGVAYTFDTEIWVDFKLFGSLGATLLFVIAQGFFISRHVQPEADEKKAES